jgi:hypothetical protein
MAEVISVSLRGPGPVVGAGRAFLSAATIAIALHLSWESKRQTVTSRADTSYSVVVQFELKTIPSRNFAS